MTPIQLPSLTEVSTGIRVAIVCEPETNVLADSIEELLADAQGFTFSRIECHSQFGVKPGRAGFGNPDVVVAALDSFDATKLELFFASLERAFPHRPVLVTTTHPDAFDVFPVLEMGASDFQLPPLRSSELLPRLMRQVRITCRSDAHVQKLKEELGLTVTRHQESHREEWRLQGVTCVLDEWPGLPPSLDGIASAHIEELSSALPGFAEAMAWPG